jgi:hypothetical protein
MDAQQATPSVSADDPFIMSPDFGNAFTSVHIRTRRRATMTANPDSGATMIDRDAPCATMAPTQAPATSASRPTAARPQCEADDLACGCPKLGAPHATC